MSKQEKMFQLVNEYQESGVSAKKFSENIGINTGTFRYWIRKKREASSAGGFVRITNQTQSLSDLELIYPNGVRLRTNPEDLGLVKKLLNLY